MMYELFEKYQDHLLMFCNTEYGRWFLQDRFGGKIEKQDTVVRVTPDGFHLFKDLYRGYPIIEATFFPESPYIKKFANILTGLDILYHQKKRQFIPPFQQWNELGFPNLYFAETTYNPDAHPEVTSVDGLVIRDHSSNETFANQMNNAGTSADDTASTTADTVILSGSVGSWDYNRRYISLFNTSSIQGGQVSAAIYSLYIESKSGGSDASLRVVTSTPASNIALVAADYGQLGTVAQASDLAWSSINTSAYNDITLNATGRGNISVGGITKFGARTDKDATGSEPATEGWNIRVTNADAGSNKPKLTVTYTPGGGAFFNSLL